MFLLTPVAHAGESETARDLTTLLRSARAVTVNKTTIADPSQFNVKKFIKKTKKNYLRASDKWQSGYYANKFLPARFARETGLEFEKLSNGKGLLKLTTSNSLLVNSDNKSDAWENDAIESKFLSASWERNKVFEEKTSDGYRLILPEYCKSGCLGCHGGEMGKSIHPGKISGELGDFGGAISVILRNAGV